MEQNKQNQNVLQTWIGGIVLFVIVITGVILYFRQTEVIDKLKAWKLWPLPEPLTELYFEDHTSLPAKVGIDPVQFRFTIHNIEYKDVNYTYRILLDSPEEQKVIEEDTIFLSQGDSITLDKQFDPAIIATRTAVAVYLPYQDQRIHFWVEPQR